MSTTEPVRPEREKKLGKREQTKANNREAILKAAREVFAELGYGATTVRDIIRRTGLASGTFYNYFKAKEDVFQALMDQRALLVRPRLRDMRATAKTFEEFIRGCFLSYFEALAADEDTALVVRRNTGAIRVRMDTPEIVAGFSELEDDIRHAIEIGLLPEVDVSYLTAAFVGVAFEIGDAMFLDGEADTDKATEFATALFMGGIKALPLNTKK